MRKSKRFYALYRGDEFIDEGTLEELAKRRKVSKHTISSLATPRSHRRYSYKNTILAYRYEMD